MMHAQQNQRGVVLVMALSMLVILTILAISSIRGSSLEIKMAGSMQDATSAFHAAESGLARAFDSSNTDSFTLDNSSDPDVYTNIGQNADATVTTEFSEFSPPKRDSGYSVINYSSANFSQISTGTTRSGATATTRQGSYQIVNKPD